MNDQTKTNAELIEEISALNQRIRKLEQAESERKEASEALHESEEYFKAIIRNSSDIVLILDKLGTITYASPSVERFLGYEPDELIGKRTLDLIVSEDKPRSIEDFGRALLTKEVLIPNVFRMRHKNSTERIFEGVGKNLLDDPIVAGFVMNVRDITDRKQMEGALRESEEKYRNLVENISEVIYEIDSQGVVIYISPVVRDIMEYDQTDIVGKSFIEFVYEDDRSRLIERFIELSKGIEYPSEYRLISKSGDIRWVRTKTNPIMEGGSFKGAHGTIIDITDRKNADEAMRESEERYRTLVENASDIIFRLDNTGHITFVNPATLRIMGYEEKEIIGRHYPTFIRSDMQEEAMKFFGRQFVKGIPNTYSEYPIIVKDGREIWLGQNTQLIFQGGKVVAFQAVARDITELKLIGEALQDSENRYRELSIVDGLTQLYNSRHFYVQLKNEMERSNRYGQPLTLLLLDLDDFKHFNDTYGHIEGDHVLMRLGQVVKRCLRETDFAFRYGGEEFTILLPMTTSTDGAVTAERIRTEFKKEIFSPAPGQDVHVTVSIGLAQYKPQEDMKAFVHRVDQLMYCGKKNGKDRVCCEP